MKPLNMEHDTKAPDSEPVAGPVRPLVERLRTRPTGDPYLHMLVHEAADEIERTRGREQEIDALRVDAARYRWLRSGVSIKEAINANRLAEQPLCIVTTPTASLPIYGPEMDAAVDAAIQARGPGLTTSTGE